MNTSNTTNTSTQTFRIASMDLVDFSTKLQEAVLQGYKLDFSNENCPIQLGTLLTCCLVKETSVEAPNEAYKPSEKQGSTEVPSEEQKPSRGRKPASKVS